MLVLLATATATATAAAQYFGVLFLGTGGVIISRVLFSDQPKPRLLLAFAGLVFLSGFLCFVLQQRFITSLRCACVSE